MKRDPLKCGGCGEETVTIAHIAPEDATRVGGGGTFIGKLEITCTRCKSVTIIGVAAPKFTHDWGVDGNGVLCGGWRS